mmetsp:Transcript_24323/g.71435  ORF Transcript_24323/g.71435 Transcript_24323/m.71435 type:complete len:90 (-) Transcript_24323:16-285(-)
MAGLAVALGLGLTAEHAVAPELPGTETPTPALPRGSSTYSSVSASPLAKEILPVRPPHLGGAVFLMMAGKRGPRPATSVQATPKDLACW